jgi:phospholipid-binding lipoprotein MlaA
MPRSLNKQRLLASLLATTAVLSVLGGTDAHAGDSPTWENARAEKKAKKTKKTKPSTPSKRKKRAAEFNPVATVDDPYGDEQVRQSLDPWEKFNRGVFAFNHQFYRFVAKPLARFTKLILPPPLRTGLENAVENIESPVRITASLLQGKFERSGRETGKLLVNSTLGIGGLWKASDRIAALKNVPSEDMGQTFGTWGIPAGPYLVLPVLGPSSARDLPGKAADACLSPTLWLNENTVSTITSISKGVIENPNRMETYDAATQDALDPYISMRESFVNYRKNAVAK